MRKAQVRNEQTRLSLSLAEESITVDPFHRDHRQEVGPVVWDRSESGVAVAFIVEDDQILFVSFVDLFNA